jgi:hypothetical protein
MRPNLCAALAASISLSFLTYLHARTSVVEAGTALRLDLDALVQRSDVALEGRVLAKSARVGDHGRVETEYVVRVGRTFVGAPISERTIRLPGGVMPDGSGTLIPGMPALAPGEDVLLFLTVENDHGLRLPVGLAQGKLRVVVDAAGVRRLVREQDGLELVSPNGGLARRADDVAALDYAETIARIEAAAAAKKAAKPAEAPKGQPRSGDKR